jgi:hypothetical protein
LACGGLLLAKVIGDLVQVLQAFGEGRAFGAHVGVVEAVEGLAQDIEHLEGHVGLHLRQRHRVAEPGALEGLAAERVAARPGKAVPIGDGKAQVVLHPLAQDHLVGVVVAEGEFVGRCRGLRSGWRGCL